MSSLTLNHAPPSRRRLPLSHGLRDVAPRLAALLPGVVCRGAATDAAGAPQVYLTFDDGPSEATTPPLLDALDRLGARGTHFLQGSRASALPALTRAVAGAGHAVGNHGWHHVDAWRARRAVESLERGRVALQDVLARDVGDARPPYGRLTPGLYRWARATGSRLVLWDLMPGEYLASASSESLAARLVRTIRPGSIVVLHDGPPVQRTIAVLDRAVPALRDAGWQFPTL